MKLHNIELINFRNYVKKDYQFGEKCAIISGKNGTGKSTIKEAILYCLYGRDLQGSTRLLDNLIRSGEKSATVSCDFGDYRITRVKNSAKYMLMLDDKSQDIKDAVVAQRDLDAMLPDAELFQSIFDAGYFLSLPENDQRRLLLKHTPDLDRKALWHDTYKDGMDAKYQIYFGDYDQERMRYKRLADTSEKALNDIRAKAQETAISPLEVQELRDKAEGFRKELNSHKIEACDKCKQPIFNEAAGIAKTALIIALDHLATAEQKLKEQEATSDITKGQIESLEQKIVDYREIYKRLSPGGMPAIEADILLKPILAYLTKQIPGLRIETLKRIKTTLDWKECFEVYVDQTPYRRLSTGEKIKVDLAFSEMLNILTDEVVDMYFVDNYESVTGKLPEVGGQLFLSQVVEDKELTVTIEKGAKVDGTKSKANNKKETV